jgi:hypothetical protein
MFCKAQMAKWAKLILLLLADCPAHRAGGQGLPARCHQAGKTWMLTRLCVKRGLEYVSLSVVENEQAAIGQGFGCCLDHFLGGGGNP